MMLKKLITAWFDPDDQSGDWEAWQNNQTGHFALGVILLFLCGSPWLVALLYGLKEFLDWRKSKQALDAFTDWLFVIGGAMFVDQWMTGQILDAWLVLAGCGIALLIGILERTSR